MDSFISLIHQQLSSTLSSMGSPLLVSCISSCFVHHLVWVPSSASSINSCFAHLLASVVLPWSLQQLFRASSGMDSFICLFHQLLFCTSYGIGSLSLVLSIKSCFLHHLVWIPYSVSSINSCFVHHLACVVLRWFQPSTFVSYIIWHRFLHHNHQSAVVMYITW